MRPDVIPDELDVQAILAMLIQHGRLLSARIDELEQELDSVKKEMNPES